jgi:hypothetical protein
MRMELGPATWITAAASMRLSAVSNPELPLPMMSTRWSAKSRGSTETVPYSSAVSMPGIGGR